MFLHVKLVIIDKGLVDLSDICVISSSKIIALVHLATLFSKINFTVSILTVVCSR